MLSFSNLSVHMLLWRSYRALLADPPVSQLMAYIWFLNLQFESFCIGFTDTGENVLLSGSHFSSSVGRIRLKHYTHFFLKHFLQLHKKASVKRPASIFKYHTLPSPHFAAPFWTEKFRNILDFIAKELIKFKSIPAKPLPMCIPSAVWLFFQQEWAYKSTCDGTTWLRWLRFMKQNSQRAQIKMCGFDKKGLRVGVM